MKTFLENKTLKIWFQTGTSRNISNVVEINHVNNLMSITDSTGKEWFINFDNVNLIEEM